MADATEHSALPWLAGYANSKKGKGGGGGGRKGSDRGSGRKGAGASGSGKNNAKPLHGKGTTASDNNESTWGSDGSSSLDDEEIRDFMENMELPEDGAVDGGPNSRAAWVMNESEDDDSDEDDEEDEDDSDEDDDSDDDDSDDSDYEDVSDSDEESTAESMDEEEAFLRRIRRSHQDMLVQGVPVEELVDADAGAVTATAAAEASDGTYKGKGKTSTGLSLDTMRDVLAAQLAVVRRALIDPQGATTLHKQISELTSNPRTKSLQLTPTTKEQKMLIKRLATYYQFDFVDRQRHHGFIEVIRRGKVLDPMLAELYGDAGEEMERILQKLEREAEDVAFESGWDTRASKKEKYGKRGGSGGSNGGGGKGKKHPHKARWEDFNENYDIDMVGGRKLSKKEKRAKQGRQVVKDKKERKREGRQGGSAASAEPRVVGATAVALTETNAGHRLLQKMGWEPGQRLGNGDAGILAPVEATIRPRQHGLGFSNHRG